MKVQLRGKKVGIEKLKSSKDKTLFIVLPEDAEYFGHIKYVGPEVSKDIEVGQKVYFGTNSLQNVRMAGTTICVINDEDVLAIITDEKNSEV